MVAADIPRATTAYDMQLLIKNLLISVSTRGFDEEIVYKDTRFTYPEFVGRTKKLANVLDGAGIASDATVAVMDWDSHRYLECYFAIPASGRVLQTVNIRLSHEQILYTLNKSGAQAIIVNRDFLPILESIRAKLESVRYLILINEEQQPDQSGIEFIGEYEELVDQHPANYDFPDFSEHAQATVFFTTGTTGNPKGVYYSHRQIVLHALASLATFGTASAQGRVGDDDVYMPITPMFHAHAWGWPYAATLIGLRQVYPGEYDVGRLMNLIKREDVSFSHCVPTLLHMILNDPRSEDIDFTGRKFLIGGSALPRSLVRQALERGIDIFTGYGMSETGPVQVINHLSKAETELPLEQQIEKRRRAGRPVMFCDVRTVDDAGRTLPKDGSTQGEIVFRSPWLTQGYLNNPSASDELWSDGWLHSGDIGVFSDDFSLRICDRKKDVIKSGGEWISSLDLENLISTHPDINEVAVIATPDTKWGERPLAIVSLKPTARDALTASDLEKHLRCHIENGTLSKFALPDRVVIVEDIAKTSVGKLDKKTLRDQYADE